MANVGEPFDPRAILAALERNYVEYVAIGGFGRVLRGSDELTRGVDICPSLTPNNLERLEAAVREFDARQARRLLALGDQAPRGKEVVSLTTGAGELKVVPAPAGAPGGFADLRRAATREHLGHGLRPLVASTADLARMAAALHPQKDPDRLRELRRIMELEVERELIGPPPVRAPEAELGPGPEPPPFRGPGWDRRAAEHERGRERGMER